VNLTKDKLARRNWQENIKFCLCDKEESIQHLLIIAHFVKVV
jgi:hypothetical protein